MTLEGKSALVTGGSRGIGRAICVRLAREGAYVIVHYGADRAAAEATVRDIHTAGGSATAVQAVLGGSETDREARELIERASSSTGKLDILVNNVGIVGPRNGIEAADADGLHRVFALNTITPFFVTKHSLGRLSDNGRIINISAHFTDSAAQADLIGYSMSKAAIDAFTRTLAKQLGARGITVNAVAPGVVDTDMNSDWLGSMRGFVAELSPLGRVADPDDVADVVAFLAGDDSRWLTGERIEASGGALL